MTSVIRGDAVARRRFILDNTRTLAPAHVPEIMLYTATEAHELWHKTEEELGQMGLPPPFWAFAWAGGQGLARYLLDHRDLARGMNILDFASGSGLVAIAASMCGARSVTAADTDEFSRVAIALNAALNDAELAIESRDLLGLPADRLLAAIGEFDLILAGDVFYDREMSRRGLEFFSRVKAAGKKVITGDPGRSYFPGSAMDLLARYSVPVTTALEDGDIKSVGVWEFRGAEE